MRASATRMRPSRWVLPSPLLTDALLDYRQTLALPNGGRDYVFASQAQTRLSDDNVRPRVVRPAVQRANARRADAGLPPLPAGVTRTRCRRTYISIALIACEMDLKWVMSQV